MAGGRPARGAFACASCGYPTQWAALSSSAARQLGGRGARVGLVAYRTHHHHPLSPGRQHLADRGGVDAADREPRPLAGVLGGVAHVVEPRGGPSLPWSAWRAPGPRSAGPPPEWSAAWSCGGVWVEIPTRVSVPSSARTRSTGASSWPTCTPSAPARAARSGRSLSQKRAPCSSQAARNTSAARSSSASPACLSRSCTMSTPPSSAARSSSRSRGPPSSESVTK